MPQPGDQIAVVVAGREVLRYQADRSGPKPYIFPLIGPGGRSVLRLGHPHDPRGHAHHLGIWLGHQDVAGHNFWEHQRSTARIEHAQTNRLEDGATGVMVVQSRWLADGSRALLLDERTITVTPRPETIDPATGFGELTVDVDLTLRAADGPVSLGKSHFGLLGVRVAKTMGVRDGGGIVTNSEGQVGETALMPHRRARWCDYSGPVAPGRIDGVTIFDHPENPRHPAFFHVRDDGWMGIALTHEAPLAIVPGRDLRLRYRLYVHRGHADPSRLEAEWSRWSR